VSIVSCRDRRAILRFQLRRHFSCAVPLDVIGTRAMTETGVGDIMFATYKRPHIRAPSIVAVVKLSVQYVRIGKQFKTVLHFSVQNVI
jgi:hypothetical protein